MELLAVLQLLFTEWLHLRGYSPLTLSNEQGNLGNVQIGTSGFSQ